MGLLLCQGRNFSRRCVTMAAVSGILFSLGLIQHARADVNDVADIFLIKANNNHQMSPANPLPKTNPFTFAVGANPRTSTPPSILSATFQAPSQPVQSMPGDGQGNFYFDGGGFATLASLNAAFPNGTYNFSFQTITPPTAFNPQVVFTGDNYPSTIPKILNGQWSSGGFQVDPTQSFTFNSNSFSPFSTGGNSVVILQVYDAANNIVFNSSNTTPVTSFNMPANTLQPDQYYGAVLIFANRLTSFLSPSTFTVTNYQVATDFKIATISGIPALSGPTAPRATVGQPFYYQIIATNHPFGYDAANLPPGLTCDSTLGVISGTPTASGSSTVRLSATNINGVGNMTITPNIQDAPVSGPLIVSSTSALAYAGRPFKFQVVTNRATAAARISATGLPAGLTLDPVKGLISGTTNVVGSFSVNLTVTDGNFTVPGFLQLTFTSDAGYPVITNANKVFLPRNQFFTYTITTPGASDPTDPPSYLMMGSLPNGLLFNSATGTISGTYTSPLGPIGPDGFSGGALLGSIQLFGTNSHGTSTFQLLFLAPPTGAVNISTRTTVGTGDSVLIGGFIITGTAPKAVVVRALGPSIGIPGVLQDPTLELHSGNQVFPNDNWKTTQEQLIRDTGLQPGDDRESAIVIALDPGNYTAIVAGKNGATGIALVEVYDLGTATFDSTNQARLGNIATRGQVGSGDNVMIGGFIVQSVASRILARALGPSLSALGVAGALQDTALALKDSNGTTLISNDDWQQGQPVEIQNAGLAPSDPREAALISTLAPGQYTTIVSGHNNTTGVALVEVYALQ
jgi:Putative Ig domain